MDPSGFFQGSTPASVSASGSGSTSTASSSRDIPSYPYPQGSYDATMYHSQQNLFSSEYLERPGSPPQDGQLPSVQVTHPTPTKPIKFRRKSAGALSVSPASSLDPSPLGHAQLLPSPGSASGSGSLEVLVDPSPRSRPRSPDDDSDAEREKLELAEKQARVREKGRERQRRKRERDKKAREANSVTVAPLTAATHLPVPSSSKPTPNNLSISVPSSVSSFSSSLPQSASYFSISPGPNSFPLTGSTSVSGASTPGTLFSPAASTPSYSPDTALNNAFFGLGSESTLLPAAFDIPDKIIKRGGTRAQARTAPTSVTKTSPVGLFQQSKPKTKPTKRRKSEPRAEEMTGLGVTGTDTEDVSYAWVEERPKPRRTASDGAVIKSSHDREWGRSPTPPPVPTLPSAYRRQSTRRLQQMDGDAMDGPGNQATTAAAEAFASRALFLLDKDDKETGWLREQIGLQPQDLESMQNALAGVYDRWVLERGMKDMSLEGSEASTNPNVSAQGSVPGSPTMSSASSALFFTPAVSRQRPAAPGAAQESPLASTHTRQRSLSSASMLARGLHINPQHNVTPLTSTQSQPQPQSQAHVQLWSQPSQPAPATPSSSQSISVEVRSDGTVSPSLQTPSTGQGTFALPDGMTGYQGQGQGQGQGHWRSATDPSGQRTFTTVHHTPTQQVTRGEWNMVPNTCPPAGISLDSPLSMAAQIKHGGMPPPPQIPANLQDASMMGSMDQQTLSQPLSGQAQAQAQSTHQRHFSTPISARNASVRAVVPVPYTPPTPVPMRGHNHTLQNGSTTIPIWYNPSFLPQPGDSPSSGLGGTHGYAHAHGQGFEGMYIDLGRGDGYDQGAVQPESQ